MRFTALLLALCACTGANPADDSGEPIDCDTTYTRVAVTPMYNGSTSGASAVRVEQPVEQRLGEGFFWDDCELQPDQTWVCLFEGCDDRRVRVERDGYQTGFGVVTSTCDDGASADCTVDVFTEIEVQQCDPGEPAPAVSVTLEGGTDAQVWLEPVDSTIAEPILCEGPDEFARFYACYPFTNKPAWGRLRIVQGGSDVHSEELFLDTTGCWPIARDLAIAVE